MRGARGWGPRWSEAGLWLCSSPFFPVQTWGTSDAEDLVPVLLGSPPSGEQGGEMTKATVWRELGSVELSQP